jgi:glyoxylate/hydroxypyruvate reductase A
MVDPALTEGMVEYVTGHVLRHHLGMDHHIHGLKGVWRVDVPPLARERTVGILGLGELGAACAEALAGLRFRVVGWSRRQKAVPGVLCRSGAEGLLDTLAEAEILVLLLPLTTATESLMDADRLGRLPEGAMIINPGRGALIDDAALITALDKGDIGHATLDVFRQEPLPPEHPFWSHPKVTVTPHIASETRPESASRVIAENIRRCEAGEPLLYLVDRRAGY